MVGLQVFLSPTLLLPLSLPFSSFPPSFSAAPSVSPYPDSSTRRHATRAERKRSERRARLQNSEQSNENNRRDERVPRQPDADRKNEDVGKAGENDAKEGLEAVEHGREEVPVEAGAGRQVLEAELAAVAVTIRQSGQTIRSDNQV